MPLVGCAIYSLFSCIFLAFILCVFLFGYTSMVMQDATTDKFYDSFWNFLIFGRTINICYINSGSDWAGFGF